MEPKNKIKLTRSDIKEIINDIEGKFPVDKWVINGIHIWPVIRIRLFADLVRLNVGNSPDYPTMATYTRGIIQISEVLKGFVKFVFAYLADYKRNKKLEVVDTVFLSGSVSSFIKINNKWYEKCCEPFIDYFKNRNLSFLLLTPSHKYYIPRHCSSIFVQLYLDYMKIKSRFILKLTRSWDEKLPNFLNFLDYLRFKNFNIRKITLPIIRREIVAIRLSGDFFKKILEKSKPSLGFVVCYYVTRGYAFNLACRELGIHSIEIQHGVQGDLHMAYGSWYKVPKTGYELLPSLFWCWSDFEAKAIQKWSEKVSKWHRPIIGGNLFLNQWLYSSSDFIKYYDQLILKFKKSYKHCKHIIFTQSGGIQSEYFMNMLHVIKNSPDSWYWWIRIHPGELELKSKMRRLLKEKNITNCNVDYATDLPLYALFRHMDILITFFSTTVIEAEKFGIPSVITHQIGAECFSDQISSGWAMLAFIPKDIITAINHQLERKGVLKHSRKKQKKQYNDKLESLVSLIKQDKRARL